MDKIYKATFKRTISGVMSWSTFEKERCFEAKSISRARKLAKDFANKFQTGRTEILSVEAL